MSAWIKVSDRLPEGNGAVLTFHNGYMTVAQHEVWSDGGHWLTVDDCVDVDVSHWMPLPKGPE